MGILIDDQKRILVQGITGREGQQRTRLMLEYGSKVIGGVTPGRGGQQVLGLPVFNTVAEAKSALGRIDISVIFVPAPRVKQAALEAISQDIQLLVLIPDRVPVYDVLEIHHAARQRNCHFLGPNTLGALNPGKAIVGMIGGRAASAKDWIKPGVVGISSRSGGMTTSLAYYLSRQYTGLSTAVHIGGDAVIGLQHPDILLRFEADPATQLMVILGEIGTSQEERAARLIQDGQIKKPVVAFINGRSAKAGVRFSHAGAIIEGNSGTYQQKVNILREAGVTVVEEFHQIPDVVKDMLRKE